MKTVYVVTMWSGGRPAKKWKSDKQPQELPQGTGVSFVNSGTRLRVTVIGSISVEEYESGKEELEMGYGSGGSSEWAPPNDRPGNIERLF